VAEAQRRVREDTMPLVIGFGFLAVIVVVFG
jgi:hypothetical protein